MSTEYEEAITGEGYKAWKDAEAAAKPVEAVAESMAAKPAPEAKTPAEAQQEGRARNPDGTFASSPEKQDTREQKEPFEGFSKLPQDVQVQFNRLRGERDNYHNLYKQNTGRLRALQRNPSAQQQPALGSSPAGQAARSVTASMAPGAQRNAAQAQIDKWEAHAKAYPDDAAAIEQRIAAFALQLQSGLHPLAQELTQLRGIVNELRGGYQQIAFERDSQQAIASQGELSRIAGDNWQQIAGWEDDNGNPVPEDKRTWHPEFVAWVEGHDPEYQDYLWQTLQHSSPKVAGKVIADFNLARFGLDNGGAQGANATPATSVAARRAEALRDTQPNVGGARTTGAPTWKSTGDAYADAIRGEGYAEWRKA